MKTTARRQALVAALLVALCPASGRAAGARGPEPTRGPENGGRREPGAARSDPGGRARDGFGSEPRKGDTGDRGRAESLGRAENLGRSDSDERASESRGAPRDDRAARSSEAHSPERPLREDSTFSSLIAHVPSLGKIVDKNEKTFKDGLTPGNKAILKEAGRILDGEGGAKTPPRDIRPPESLHAAVREVEKAIPEHERGGKKNEGGANERGAKENEPGARENERGRDLEQPGFDIEQARQAPVPYIRGYVRGLQEKSDKAQKDLDELGEKVAKGPEQGSGAGRYEGRQKKKEFTRIMQKVREKDGYASKVYDLAAGRVVYPTMAKLCEGLKNAAKALEGSGASIVRVKERFTKPMSSGYRDVLMNIRTKEGIITELRFELEPLLRIAEEEHLPYEMKRGLDDLAIRERRAPSSDEERLKNAIDQVTRPNYDKAFEQVLRADSPGHAAEPRRAPGRARPFRALPWRSGAPRAWAPERAPARRIASAL